MDYLVFIILQVSRHNLKNLALLWIIKTVLCTILVKIIVAFFLRLEIGQIFLQNTKIALDLPQQSP
tara:strand:- start:418 stop:615 length:198 start_codon:yes stop_codon:yes gene_type:complete